MKVTDISVVILLIAEYMHHKKLDRTKKTQ